MELDYRCISPKTFSFWKGLRVMVPGKVLTALNLSVSGQGFIYIRSAWGKGREGIYVHFGFPPSLYFAQSETPSCSSTPAPWRPLRAAGNMLAQSHA